MSQVRYLMCPGWTIWNWRREWDSNPRYAFTYTRVPGVRLKPLGHLSGIGNARDYSRWQAKCKHKTGASSGAPRTRLSGVLPSG
jgi:hypothetical protein